MGCWLLGGGGGGDEVLCPPFPHSHPPRNQALTDSNSPCTGASEIGIEDRLRRERMRQTLT